MSPDLTEPNRDALNRWSGLSARRHIVGALLTTDDTLDRTQSPLVLKGERIALDYLARLHRQRVEADELAAVVAMLRDAVSLVGFCRVIEKALGGRHV